MYLIWTIFISFLGLCIGSFLNVCIWRLPQGESIISPPSHCPKCNHTIRWYENIPLLSWTFLRGRCSNCKTPISIRYFCVELLTALMFLSVWFKAHLIGKMYVGIWFEDLYSFNLDNKLFIPFLVANLVVVVLIILTAFIDWDHRIIPDKITYPVIFYGIVSAGFFPGLWPLANGSALKAVAFSCASVAISGGALALFAIIGKKCFKKDALGWGDVKYIAAIAAVLGPWACFVTVLAGSIIGSVAGLTLIAMKKGKLKSGIPFGPPLVIGTYLWILWGYELMVTYSRFTAYIRNALGVGS